MVRNVMPMRLKLTTAPSASHCHLVCSLASLPTQGNNHSIAYAIHSQDKSNMHYIESLQPHSRFDGLSGLPEQ